MLEKIKYLFSEPDQDVIVAYQYKIPKSITVEVEKSSHGYTAKVEKINDKELNDTTFLTEAETMSELIVEVNDMLLTYLDFPEYIKPRMPHLLPPELEKLDTLKAKSHKEVVFAK